MDIGKVSLNYKTLYFLLFATFICIPIYIFPSGGFQLVDIPIVLGVIFIIFTTTKQELTFSSTVYIMLGIYILWSVAVNSVYFMKYYDLFYIKASVQNIFALLLFSIFTILFQRLISFKNGIMMLHIAFLLSLLLPFFVKGAYDTEGEIVSLQRNAFSFNNPNQLAYFSILIYAMFILLNIYSGGCSYNRWEKKLIIFTYFIALGISHYFVIYSASRAGITAIILLDMIVIWNFKKTILIIIPLFLMLLLTIKIFNLDTRINFDYSKFMISKRITKENIKESLSKRILERFSQNLPNDEAILYGAGKTLPITFKKEVHNSFIDILLSYGIIGLLLFLSFLLNLIKAFSHTTKVRRHAYYLPILLCVFTYNLFHNGFRFRLFWMFLAFWYVLKTYIATKDIEHYSNA